MNEAEHEQLRRLHLYYPNLRTFSALPEGDISLAELEVERTLEDRLFTLHTLLDDSKDQSKDTSFSWESVLTNSLNLERFKTDRDNIIRAISQVPFQLPPRFDTQQYEDIVFNLFQPSLL